MKYFVLLSFVVVCFCCNRKETPISPFKEYHIEKAFGMKGETVWLDSISDSISIIPLETSDRILMGGGGHYYLYNDLLFISHAPSQGKSRLSVFDLSGKYLWDIGSQGQGPGEYININGPRTIFFNNNRVYLNDVKTCSILCYSLNGEFIRKIKYPNRHYFKQFTFIEKDNMAGFLMAGCKSRIIFMDEDGKYIDSIAHYTPYDKIVGTSEFDGGFFNYNGQKYIKEAYYDTVFLVKKDMKLYPEYILNSGKYAIRYEDIAYLDRDERSQKLLNSKLVNVVFENDGCIIATRWGGEEVKNWATESRSYILIDKASGTAKKVFFYYSEETCKYFLKEKIYLNPAAFGHTPGMSFDTQEPRLMNDGSPTFLINNVSEDNTIWIGSERPLDFDDNPVIILIHLKK